MAFDDRGEIEKVRGRRKRRQSRRCNAEGRVDLDCRVVRPGVGGREKVLTSWGSRCGQPANRRNYGSWIADVNSRHPISAAPPCVCSLSRKSVRFRQQWIDRGFRKLVVFSLEAAGGICEYWCCYCCLRPNVQGTGWVVERAWDINCVELWTRRPRCADRKTGVS